MAETQNKPDGETEPDWIQWVENETCHVGSVPFLITEEYEQIEQCLSTSCFLHGTEMDKTYFKKIQAFYMDNQERIYKYQGITTATRANTISFVRVSQYRVYCNTVMLPRSIQQAQKRIPSEIGGYSQTIGATRRQVPFRKWCDIIDVGFTDVEKNTPPFLSMKDILDHGLNLSI